MLIFYGQLLWRKCARRDQIRHHPLSEDDAEVQDNVQSHPGTRRDSGEGENREKNGEIFRRPCISNWNST